jgi:heme/copper-type cytochrome/quinol oxidase subunit 2
MTCLPLLIGLMIYGGIILMNILSMIRERNCHCDYSNIVRENRVDSIISSLVMVSILYILCKFKFETGAWIVVITPIVISIILFMIIAYRLSCDNDNDYSENVKKEDD